MKLGFVTTLAVTAALTVPTVVIAQTTIENLQRRNQPSPSPNRMNTIVQTTIGSLQQQNSTTISGDVVRVQGEDFILGDGTGQILVEADARPIRQANLQVGDRVTVSGNYDDDNSFEALSITPENGTVIYVFDD